jgi:hypothetical protein
MSKKHPKLQQINQKIQSKKPLYFVKTCGEQCMLDFDIFAAREARSEKKQQQVATTST